MSVESFVTDASWPQAPHLFVISFRKLRCWIDALNYRTIAGRRVLILPTVAFIVIAQAALPAQDNAGSNLYLQFDPKPVLQQGTVAFVRAYADPGSMPAPPDKEALVGYSDDFKLVVDRQSFRFDQFGGYTFTAFTTPLKGNKTIYIFYARAVPQGTFADLEDTVTFHLHHGEKDSSGTILLPLHSVGSNDLLENANSSTLETTKLSGGPQPHIRLRSTLPSFALQITQVEVSSACSDCWSELAPPNDLKSGSSARVLTAKGQDTDIVLVGKPRTWPSLRSSLVHFKMSDAHDKLALRVTYSPIEGGRVRTQDFEIPVRFSPSIWEVVLVLVLGTATGIIVRRVLGQADAFSFKQIAGISCAVLASEFILYLSISDTRPLVLFGFNADPTQPLTIALIALFVSGGPKLKTWLAQVIQQLWDQIKATSNSPGSAGQKND